MKFKFIDEQDKDIRDILKTFPWVGICFTIFIGYILLETVLTSAVKMRDGYSPIFYEIKILSSEDHPVLFIVVILLETTILAILLAYLFIRITIRRRLIKEDKNL